MEPSKKVRDAIDRLSPEELGYEINLGKASRFSRAIPYMQKRFDQFENDKAVETRSEDREDRVKDRRVQIGIAIILLGGLLVTFCATA